jgi:hypothetical protein
MKQGEIKTILNSDRKHPMENGSYEAVYLTKNNETDLYLFTQVELNKGLQRARMQPEEQAENPMSLDLTAFYYGACIIVGIVLGAIFF